MKGIGYSNMKVFKDYQWFDFKDITILTGTNNSGKSSIINTIQMLQENINANNIEELLKTKFTLKNNQEKQGSIANFVNNEAKGENDNRFLFSKQNGGFVYDIVIEITNDGLESCGNIIRIQCFDAKTEEEVFDFDRLKTNEGEFLHCGIFKINYNYFIEKFYKKCANTENLLNRKVELDALIDGVNNNKNTMEEFNTLAEVVAKEYGVNVYSQLFFEYDEFGMPLDTDYEVCYITNDSKSKIDIETENILKNANETEKNYFYDNRIDISKEEFQKMRGINFLDEKVLFDERGYLLPEYKYNELYKNFYKNGIVDFSSIWNYDKEAELEFKKFICLLYLKDFEESYKLFYKDIMTIISNNKWYHGFFSGKFELTIPEVLRYLFFEAVRKVKHNKIKEYNDFFWISNKAMIEIEETNFFEEFYNKFLLYLYERSDNCSYDDNLQPDFDYNFDKSHHVNELIFKDIEEVIYNLDLNFNNLYVSSKRFEAKRQYNFKDQTDFTNLLKQIEALGKEERIIANNFINKWLQEFKIADELILKPDTDTGNFKAILRNGNKETQLADFGLGTNQLLPVIFALSICEFDLVGNNYIYFKSKYHFRRRTIMIEEPEANLHPAMQSKLADMLVEATVKYNVQVIIETHSEYLIRKMQYLVAKDNFNVDKNEISISNKRVNIYYINAELDEMGRKAYEIKINKNGQLTEDFGEGFIDETLRWKIELTKLNNEQKN